MGTNYYRIPTQEEMEERKSRLERMLERMEMTPKNVHRKFSYLHGKSGHDWETFSPWDMFTEGIAIHLGKRSGGWVFAWDHNDWKYFGKSKEELFKFIRSGRVVNEYDEEIPVEEFIEMALKWYPEGMTNDKYYDEMKEKGKYLSSPEMYKDIIVDGLRFLNYTDFS